MSSAPPTVRLLGLSGSLRRASKNTALLRAAAELAPVDVEVIVHHLGAIPMYDGDLEADGLPAPVRALRDEVAAADGLLLATPEYNWSVSGALKNAIDWLSRGAPAPIDGLPTGLLSAAGSSGGRRAQAHLRDVLAHNQLAVVDRAVQIAGAGEHVVDGHLRTPTHRDEVARLVREVRDLVRRRAAAEVA